MHPSNTAALNNYAYYLAAAGVDLDGALSSTRTGESQSAGRSYDRRHFGFVFLKKNLPRSAESIFCGLTAKYPSVAVFRIHLAEALSLSGDNASAERELDAARGFDLTPAELKEIKSLTAKLQYNSPSPPRLR